MSQEWLFSQLCCSLGGADKLMSLLPTNLIATFIKGVSITSFPQDLLAHVLSYIHISDICNVRLTCVVFAQAMRKQHFWHKFIKDTLEKFILHYKCTTLHAKFIREFNTFGALVEETLRDQVEWIFKWKRSEQWPYPLLVFEVSSNNECATIRRGAQGKGSLIIFKCKDGYQHVMSTFIGDGTRRCVFKSGKYNGVFTGGCEAPLYGGYVFTAHGSGKWVFDDGSVLEGSGVAFENEPRYILNRDEWQSVVKRRRIESPPPPPRSGGGGGGEEDD